MIPHGCLRCSLSLIDSPMRGTHRSWTTVECSLPQEVGLTPTWVGSPTPQMAIFRIRPDETFSCSENEKRLVCSFERTSLERKSASSLAPVQVAHSVSIGADSGSVSSSIRATQQPAACTQVVAHTHVHDDLRVSNPSRFLWFRLRAICGQHEAPPESEL